MVQQLTSYPQSSHILNSVRSNSTGKPITSVNSTPTSGTGTSTTTGSNIGSTFLSLLVQELQNQDPTAPIDSTAMVGQMISLNQLDQLVSINQAVGGNTGSLNGALSSASATTSAESKPTADNALSATPLSFDSDATVTR